MKTKYVLVITLSILLLASIAFACYLSIYKSSVTGHDWEGHAIQQIEAQAKIDYFTQNIQFDNDGAVLPSASYVAIDSIIAVMKEHGNYDFQYIFEVHSYQEGRNDAEELRYARQVVAHALREYIIHSGIHPSKIEAAGRRTKERDFFEENDDVNCFHRNNRLEILVR